MSEPLSKPKWLYGKWCYSGCCTCAPLESKPYTSPPFGPMQKSTGDSPSSQYCKMLERHRDEMKKDTEYHEYVRLKEKFKGL